METDLVILPDEEVIVTQTNHVVEVQHMEHMNTEIKIRKLDKYHYMILETGEIKELIYRIIARAIRTRLERRLKN